MQGNDAMTNKPITEKAKRLVKIANHVGTVDGVPFYESPTMGEESPLLYINFEGKAKKSFDWELPEKGHGYL